MCAVRPHQLFHRRVGHSFARHRGGASAIEFAIVLPILLALLMGVIEFGMIFYSQNSAQNAARDVVRQIATNRITADQAETVTKPQLAAWVVEHAKIDVTETAPGSPSDNQITVAISFPTAKAAPTQFFSWLFSESTTHSRATMQQEAKL